MNDAAFFLSFILFIIAAVGIPWAIRLDRLDRETEIRQWRYRNDFPRKPGCRCRLCLVALKSYKADAS